MTTNCEDVKPIEVKFLTEWHPAEYQDENNVWCSYDEILNGVILQTLIEVILPEDFDYDFSCIAIGEACNIMGVCKFLGVEAPKGKKSKIWVRAPKMFADKHGQLPEVFIYKP